MMTKQQSSKFVCEGILLNSLTGISAHSLSAK